jgi:hypothetical protein
MLAALVALRLTCYECVGTREGAPYSDLGLAGTSGRRERSVSRGADIVSAALATRGAGADRARAPQSERSPTRAAKLADRDVTRDLTGQARVAC